MPELLLPLVDVHASFVAGMKEFEAEGRGAAEDDSMVGREIRRFRDSWHDPAEFARFVRWLRAQSDQENPDRPPTHVPCTTWWWVEGQEYLGRIALRHRLNEFLFERGGHIGYDVRPSARRRGHATAMLRAVLPLARALGIESALVTCLRENVASRRVIETCGGVLEDERAGMLRFWVPTG